jgi:hypothetical protein
VLLVPVKIFQFQDMLNESERYRDAANGLVGSGMNELSKNNSYSFEMFLCNTKFELFISWTCGFNSTTTLNCSY